MRDTRPDYPPEYDMPACHFCGEDETECQCPTAKAVADWFGMGSLADAIRAYDRHGLINVGVELSNGERLFSHQLDAIRKLREDERICQMHVGGIAWNGTDWEMSLWCKPNAEEFYEAVEYFESERDMYLAECEAEDEDEAGGE